MKHVTAPAEQIASPSLTFFCHGFPADAVAHLRLSKLAADVQRMSTDRKPTDYLDRIRSTNNAAIACWENVPADLLLFCVEYELHLVMVRRVPQAEDEAGLVVEPVDLDASRLGLAPEEISDAPLQAEPDPLEGILFSRRDGETAPPVSVVGEQSEIPISHRDISLAFGVRVHDGNPWVLDRLRFAATYYDPMPNMVVVDYGSELDHSERIHALCEELGLTYAFVQDRDVFSLSNARNRAAEIADTEFVFHSDPDFVFPRDFFARISRLASIVGLRRHIDITLMCAAYHLTADATRRLVAQQTPNAFSDLLESIGFHSVTESFKRNVEFIAPYSNTFLVNKSYFSLVGGYNPAFRGHGSEDFEYFLSSSRYSHFAPLPPEPETDTGGPLADGFFGPKKYVGFRALNNVVALPGELSGLKAFHLHHPKAKEDSWHASNDWRREKLNQQLKPLHEGNHNVLSVDGLSRPRKALCVCIHKEHWGYFAPLRLRGYKIVPLFSDSVENIEWAATAIENGEIDAFAVFNPYMTSHSKLRSLYHLAREKCKTIIVERGALPSTIYYSTDVAYADPSYGEEAFVTHVPTEGEIDRSYAYIAELRTGASTLEENFSYNFTLRKYTPLTLTDRQICFCPLQLDQDMAVTMFVRDAQSYNEYLASINDVAMKNEDVLFIVKQHPLSKSSINLNAPNIIIADNRDNVHTLIDIATHTICYNSGVGLLSLIHGKPTYTIGNAYYNRGGLGRFCSSFSAAVAEHRAHPVAPDSEGVARLVGWLREHRYSEFMAIDDIREFADRKSHGYKHVVVTRFVLDGIADDLGRQGKDHPFSEQSYVAGHLGMAISAHPPKLAAAPPQPSPAPGKPAPTLSTPVSAPTKFASQNPAQVELPLDVRPKLHLASRSTRRGDGLIEIGKGEPGHGVYGPYVSLTPGAYRILVQLEAKKAGFLGRHSKLVLDVATNGGQDIMATKPLSTAEIAGGAVAHEIDFDIAGDTAAAIEMRIWTDGRQALQVHKAVLMTRANSS